MKNISKAHISVTATNETATIYLEGRFTFHDQSNFEHECVNITNNAQIKEITVDFEKVKHIDSSALGMLLVLRDQARLVGASVFISNLNGGVLKVMNAAHFGKIFNLK